MRKYVAFLLILGMLLTMTGGQPVTADAEELFVTIIHTNDEHSALVPSPMIDYHSTQANPALGGFPRLAQFVADTRTTKAATGEPVLVLNAGDFLGGSPFAWLALEGFAPELTLMQHMGYDVAIIGNHEYDYGPDLLAKYLQAAGYPGASQRTQLLASNTLPPAGHALNDLGLQKTIVRELENGLKVGMFSLIGKDAISVAPYSDPMEFSDQHETARDCVAELKGRGVDLIIAITHAGIDEDRDLARAVSGIDVIVGGHSHDLLEAPVLQGDTIIVQSGELLKHVGYLELAFNPGTGAVRVRNTSGHVVPLDHTITSNPEMSSLVQEYIAELNALVTEMTGGRFTDIAQTVVWSNFIVSNEPQLRETAFGNFVTDAMRLVAEEVTGERVHVAFQANGVLRGSIEPGSMPWSQGQVSFYDLADLVGLGSGPDEHAGYPLVSVYFTGEELRRTFEVLALLPELMGNTYFLQLSGARLEYDPNRAVLLTIPFLDLPIPTTRAVQKAELYTGTGIQDQDSWLPIERGDETLYQVVTDYYIASFLPMVGDLLPSLELILKDKDGNPIDKLEDAIIYRDGKELKVWQAVMQFAAAQPADAQGNPRIPEYYAAAADRLVHVKTFPLMVWVVLILLIFIALIVLAVRCLIRWRRRRKQRFSVA